MFKEILVAIGLAILTTFILTPFLYALNPVYTPVLTTMPFGFIIIFVLNNFNFIIFIALGLYIWKGLIGQQEQNNYGYGVGQ